MSVAPAPHLRRVGQIVTIASLIAIAFATLTPEQAIGEQSHFCLLCGSVGTVDAILNVLLFVPLGVGLALSGAERRHSLIAIFALSALIETAQFFVIAGRDSTVGDLLTNTLGGALGFGVGRHTGVWLLPPRRIGRRLFVGWATIWLAIQTVSNFGFAPSLPVSPYYGQLARVLGNFAVFPGRVLIASIDGIRIPDTALEDSRAVQRLLRQGATVAVAVVPAEPTRKLAPIVRVADARQREILLLAQDGDEFIFGVRTGAAVLRIRRPLFALAGVFPTGHSAGSSVGDTLTLAARYAATGVRIHAHSGSTNRDRLIPLTASLGWTLLLPFQWLIEDTAAERLASLIWFAGLAIPLGYWAILVRDSARAEHSLSETALALLFSGALLLAGLIVIPYAFGFSGASISDWLATLGGFVLGYGARGQAQRAPVIVASGDAEHKR